MFQVQTLRSSGEDVDLIVTGSVEGTDQGIFFYHDDTCVTARMMSVTFSIETGAKVLLYWEGLTDHQLILPLEGRGTLDFTKFGGLSNPKREGWTGQIGLQVVAKPDSQPKHYTLAFELSKQRN